MVYERQFFTKGQVLTAEEMNEIDYWLAHICGREITAAETNSRGELVFIFRDGGTLNIGSVVGVSSEELKEAVEKALQEAKDSGEFDDGGGFNITDDGNGNVVITTSGGVSITDDGNGNVVIHKGEKQWQMN